MLAGMRAVTIQSNKIVSNEVKDNVLEPSYRNNTMDFLANPTVNKNFQNSTLRPLSGKRPVRQTVCPGVPDST